MIKRLVFFSIIAVFVPVFVFCANVDSSLYTGNNKQLTDKYEKLLISLKTPENINYNTQKTILYTLINILKYPDTSAVLNVKKTDIKNQRDYIGMLKKIAKLRLKYKSIDSRINNLGKKLRILKNSINSAEDNSSSVMTYQLQYAFYQITVRKLQNEKQLLEKRFPSWENFLYIQFIRVNFDDKEPKRIIKDDIKKYEELSNYIEKLNIEKDRLMLLNKTDRLSILTGKLNETLQTQDLIVFDIINNYMLIDLYYLKHSQDLTDTEKSIEQWIKKLTTTDNAMLAEEENNLLYYITKKKMGAFKTFIKQIGNSGSHISEMVWGFVTKPLFSLGSAKISIFNIVLAIFVFIAGIYIGNTYKKRIKTAGFSKNITLSTKTILGNIGYYTIILITFFISLKVIGINLSSLTVILGALSVGIGFGLQNMVSNFISGIILMLENSIRIGDYIEISDTLKGVVKDIQMRSTTVTTNDNIEVIIPNQTLFQNNVINWTLTEKVKRFRIPFGVAYGTDITIIQDVILSALEKSGLNYIKNIPDKAPEIKMIAMNSSSVDFNLDIWVKGDDVIYPRRTESKFLIMIYNTLYEHNITIPFPQLDIHVKEPVVLNSNNNEPKKD